MISQWFEITPTDTLFFRDGRPYNQHETITLAGVNSIFPPSPATLAGAILSAYANKIGWDGGAWTKDKSPGKELGVGDNINLEFSGVFLKKDGEILFPIPQHLVELRPSPKPESSENEDSNKKSPCKTRKHHELKQSQLAFLTPSKQPYRTDLGEVHLPVVENKQENTVIKPLDDYWITKQGLKQCLNLEKLPEKNTLYHCSELWQVEPRVSIARNHVSHTNEQGMLYSPSHIRLCNDVSMSIEVKNAPDKKIDGSIILGGEARTARINTASSIGLPNANAGNLIYIASPTAIKDPSAIDNLHTACMPKLLRFGGWDATKGYYGEPRPLLPFLAPGTVLFMNDSKTKEKWQEQFKTLQPEEFTQQRFGYGQFFLGQYGNKQGESE